MKSKSDTTILTLASEGLPIVPASQLRPGVIALANEDRLTPATYSEPLTAYAIGWRDTENLQGTLDFIAPRVPVSRRFEFKSAINSDSFLTDADDERAIGSAFKRVEYRGKTGLEKTRNRGLTYRLDHDEEGGILTQEYIVGLLRQRMLRNKLKRALTALQAINAGKQVTWDANAQPDQDMADAAAEAQLESGMFPNRGIIGLVGWNARRKAYASQQNAGATAAYGLTPAQVGQALGLDDLRTERSLFQLTTSEKKRFLESVAIFFYAQDAISKDDPSHLKQFVTPVGDGDYRVYVEEKAKFTDITVESYDTIVATSTIGAAKLLIK